MERTKADADREQLSYLMFNINTVCSLFKIEWRKHEPFDQAQVRNKG